MTHFIPIALLIVAAAPLASQQPSPAHLALARRVLRTTPLVGCSSVPISCPTQSSISVTFPA